MSRKSVLAIAAVSVIGIAGCASRPVHQTVAVPPRIDLKQHEVIGVVEFNSKADGKLAPFATSRFVDWSRRDQGVVRIVRLGSRKAALRSIGRDRLDLEAIKALGEKNGVQTIFTGELIVSDIKPRLQMLTSLHSANVSAQVNATLEVQLVETSTGASLWSTTASASREVGQVSVSGGKTFTFDADDPERAYGDLVDGLVSQATCDFRTTWERR